MKTNAISWCEGYGQIDGETIPIFILFTFGRLESKYIDPIAHLTMVATDYRTLARDEESDHLPCLAGEALLVCIVHFIFVLCFYPISIHLTYLLIFTFNSTGSQAREA